MGRSNGLIFPRREERPWLRHDYQNWRRRVWHDAREQAGVESLPPYDLRHAFASLHMRAETADDPLDLCPRATRAQAAREASVDHW